MEIPEGGARMDIAIAIGDLTMSAELNGSATAKRIAGVLPISVAFSTWGDEIYFAIPVDADLEETARDEVELGDLGYWPTGKAFCIFFGLTPMSENGRIIPASAVNIIGKVTGDATRFKSVMGEGQVTVSAV